MDRDKFFAMLDQLNTSQIEARLPSWDDEQLKLVEEYLERRTIKTCATKEARCRICNKHAESVAVAMATKANKIATVALIIAIGAMVAAVASRLVAYEALQQSWTRSTLTTVA